MPMEQPQEFNRFIHAQSRVYDRVLRELAAGRKTTHWMWFIFPQLRGLGYSVMARRYAIVSLKQACRYLAHDVLGERLRQCTALVLQVPEKNFGDVFGGVDTLKFRSCITLFSLCAPSQSVFDQALAKYFAGKPDENTLRLLKDRGELPVSDAARDIPNGGTAMQGPDAMGPPR